MAEMVAGHIERPTAGDILFSGQRVEVRWTALPPAVSECELLLSLDGGREYMVRLTPELEGTTRELAWFVPNLPTPRARLRLRVGLGGREIESATSAAFTIIGNSDAPLATVHFARGEWWTATVAGTSQTEIPTRKAHLGPAGDQAPETFLALLTEEPLPIIFSAGITPLQRPHGLRAGAARCVRLLPLRPLGTPQRE